uniref:hypothetical protein n=1 Tax=uncultured Demequina sp. TaxID=693499 RepID=UPI0025F9F067
LQVKRDNGMTAELQIVPAPFARAAARNRAVYERFRTYHGRAVPEELQSEQAREKERSRAAFRRAWEEWVGAGGTDFRKTR